MDPRERELERLDEELATTDDPEEQRFIRNEMREIHRDMNEEDQWREEGYGRGWL
jgi:hypothetical protein